MDPQMERQLFRWMKEEQRNGREVTANDLKRMSMSFIQKQFKGTFKASKGWLEKFLKRNKIHDINKDNYGKDSDIYSFLHSNNQNISDQKNTNELFQTEISIIS